MDEETPSEYSESSDFPDVDLTEQDSLYLIKERIENLREMIAPTFDEIVELHNLESVVERETPPSCIPEDLGVPGKTDQLIAALEAKRVNRKDDQYYDGGDIEEIDEDVSNINQHYQTLLKESFLNSKSLSLLSVVRLPVVGSRDKAISIFDLYETAPPKLTFPEFLAKLWKISEEESLQRLKCESKPHQWNLKKQWERYLEERELKIPSPYQQVLFRCHDLATSEIYEDMHKIGDEHFHLECGGELRFTDKTAVFTIPYSVFDDIPRKKALPYEVSKIAFLNVVFILPEYAHERKRFFRKGGTVKEFAMYFEELGSNLSEKQIRFLSDLVANGSLRLYREVLELPDKDEIGGYFLNFRNGCKGMGKGHIQRKIREHLREEKRVSIRHVTRFSTWYPEWMRKIEGFIVEEKEGSPVSVPKPLQVSVDNRLPKHAFKREQAFMPSINLNHAMLPKEKWEAAFLTEMRDAYKRNPQIFRKYAGDIAEKKVELHCGCQGNNGEKIHEERCPMPLLEIIFKKIPR